MKHSKIIKTSINNGFLYAKLYHVLGGKQTYQSNVCVSLEKGYKSAAIELDEKVKDEWGLSLWRKTVIAA